MEPEGSVDHLIRIAIVEDDPAVLERFSGIIQNWTQGVLVAACANLEQILRILKTAPIDILITDMKLPDGWGTEAIRYLSRFQTDAQSMVISGLYDERIILEAIEAGATGYLLKDADSLDIIKSIQDLREGTSPISPRIARLLVARVRGNALVDRDAPVRPAALTAREMDVLKGISKGFTYREIAQLLDISDQTVPVHVRNIYRKLQVGNRSEAVFEAMKNGIL